jgi:hypothetical protein
MTKDEVKAVLERSHLAGRQAAANWQSLRSKSRQNLPGTAYHATPDELAAIDEGLAGEVASEEKVKAAFDLFPKA